jgi:transposase InsO family protein
MKKDIVPPPSATAIFKMTILGPLISKGNLLPNELKISLHAIAERSYMRLNGRSVTYSIKTIERWYYIWLKEGLDGLDTTPRSDKGKVNIPPELQEKIITLKETLMSRSINTIISILELNGDIAKGALARSTVHRLLKNKGISKCKKIAGVTTEHRAFEAEHIGDIWYGDVMHGPKIYDKKSKKHIKAYLVSVMDDASRLICHSGFYTNETELSIQHALKEAILKRGLPKKFVVDNGSAYRSNNLAVICARLGIKLIFCRPYAPEGKGKLERWHSYVRSAFLSEINIPSIVNFEDLNTKLWFWLEKFYHEKPHAGLANNVTPQERWMAEYAYIKSLGAIANQIDDYFYHREKRKVKKDSTVSFAGSIYEVPFELTGKYIYLVVDPFDNAIVALETLTHESCGSAFPLNKLANNHRHRQQSGDVTPSENKNPGIPNLVDSITDKAIEAFDITSPTKPSLEEK